jgi:4-hydroxyproline epimerase
MGDKLQRISVIDSHTGGEPTRVVIDGAPDLGASSVCGQLRALKSQHDWLRTAAINEPRGSEVLVGALLCRPSDPSCIAGVIFFNNVGYIGMCGHGTIGVMTTLAHLGRIQPGTHHLETPVGVVGATLHEDGTVSVQNVPSYRKAKEVLIDVPGVGSISGDVAYSGNWFYLVEAGNLRLEIPNVAKLTEVTWKIRQVINAGGYPEIDHVELFGPPTLPHADSRNFVLCPGKAYDRSACGTGTSAKLACLAADGKLPEGEPWVQESIVGSTFTGRYRWLERVDGTIEPTIRGQAFITGETVLVLDDADPFRNGFAGPTL